MLGAAYLGLEHSRAVAWCFVLIIDGEVLEPSLKRFRRHYRDDRGIAIREDEFFGNEGLVVGLVQELAI